MARHPIDEGHWLYKKTPEEWLALARATFDRGVNEYRSDEVIKRFQAATGTALNAVLACDDVIDARYGRDHKRKLRFFAGEQSGASRELRDAALWVLEAKPYGADADPYVLRSLGEKHLLRAAGKALLAHAAAVVERTAPRPG